MNILMVCPDWFPFSAGLANSCLDLCKQMEKRGHKVKIVVANDKGLDSKEMNIVPIDYFWRMLGRNPVVFGLRKKVEKEILWADRVCLFSYMYFMNCAIARYAKDMGKPTILFYRGSLESSGMQHISLLTRTAKKAYDFLYAKKLFRRVDHIISNSGPTISTLANEYNVSIEKMTYVKNALNIEEYVLGEEEKRVIYVGRLVENKGIKLFSKIKEALPKDWTFTVVGDGPLREEVEELEVDYRGRLSHEETKKLISTSGVLVLPSYAEGAPRAVMEALALGVPSVAFSVGDVSNMLPKGVGFAIPDFNADLFCEKVKYLCERDDAREEMKKKSREFAKVNLDWEKVYPKIEDVLTK